MNENPAKSRLWKIVSRVLLGSGAAVLLAGLGLTLYVRTDSFRERVHRRLIAALEDMTGGRVELGKFNVVPFRFRIEAHDLTIHGHERPGEIPYAHVDHLVAYIKIVSIFEKEYGFNSLSLDHPVIHIIVNPDGSTNQPMPKIAHASEKTPVEQLFAISIGRLQVNGGELLWNNERIPLDFASKDISGTLNYSLLHSRYEGSLRIGKADTKLTDCRPFSSILESRFELGQTYIDVSSLKWSSGRSHLEAKGRVENFRSPRFTGNYNGQLDLAELGSVARMHQMRAGTMTFTGKGSYSASDFLASGKLAVGDLEWIDEGVALRKVDLGAQYDLSRSRLKFSGLQGRLLGGSVAGDAEVVNWMNTAEARPGHAQKKLNDEQHGMLVLKLKDFSVPAVAAAFSTRRYPLERLNLAGAATGSIEARWRGHLKNADASFALDVVPPSQPSPQQLPVNARARGTYRGSADELELSELSLATRSTQIAASGKLSSTSSLRFTAATTSLTEWQPALLAFRGPHIPVVLHGHATFNGTAVGRLSDFALNGHLQMTNFTSATTDSGTGARRDIQWDALNADVQLSPRIASARNGLLVHGFTSIRFDASATLQKGDFTDKSPFTAHANIRNAAIADLESLAGYDLPATGRINLFFEAGGTKADPRGEGQLQLSDATIYGQPVSRMTSDVRYSHGEASLNNLLADCRGAKLSGGAAYGFNTHDFHFSLTGNGFDLAQFPELQKSRVRVDGRMDFTAQGSGTLSEPVVNAKIHLHDLAFDKQRAGDFTFDAVTHGADLKLTGRSGFEQAQLSIDGSVHLRDDFLADLSLKFDHLNIDLLTRRYLKEFVTGHSAVAGNLQLRGPLRHPRELSANGDLSYLTLDLENIRVQNEGPIRFSVAKQIVNLEQLRLTGEGTDLSARGTFQLTGNHDLDLRADGRLNMKLLESFSPDLTSAGIVNVGVAVNGTVANPSFQGKLAVTNGALTSVDLPNGLSNINGSLVFNQNRLQIETLTAQIGGGNINLTGFMTFGPQLNFNITAEGHDVRLRPAGVSATANAELHLTGSSSEALLSGDVTVVKLGLTPGFDFAHYLEGSKQAVSLPQANTLLNKIRLDVHVVTTPELQMQSSLGKLSGDADLRLRGTPVRPVVIGRVDIMEGDVYFNGTKYRLERGEITFTGPVGIKPTLDLEASTRVRDYDVTLGVNGTPEKLNFTYRSEPPLPSADIIALLAVGRTQQESSLAASSGGSPFSQEASNVILSQALNATLSNRAQRLFGISRIKIDPQGLNSETTPTHSAPAVTIEQQVSNNLTLSYSTEVSQASQQIIQGEYNVTRNISILAVRDQNGVLSFDFRFRQRRK